MKNEKHSKYINIAVYGLVVIVAGALSIILMLSVREFIINRSYAPIFRVFSPFIYGAVFAYLLNPLMSLCERKLFRRARRRRGGPQADAKLRRALSLTTTFVIFLMIVSLLSLMVFPQIGASVNQLTSRITDLFMPAEDVSLDKSPPETGISVRIPETDEAPSGYDMLMGTKLGDYISGAAASVQHFISDFGFQVDIEQSLRDFFLSATAELAILWDQYYQTIINTTATFIFTTARQVVNVLVGLVLALYILAEKEHIFLQFKKLLYAVFPVSFIQKARDVTRTTHRTFYNFITGKALDSLIVGALCFIGMSVLRFNYPLLISVIVGITNMIPFFGPFIGAIAGVLFLSVNDWRQGVWFAVFILILQQIDGNIIGPRILGSTIGISPFWVVFAILVFSGLLGPLGMFIGVPLFAVIHTLLGDFAAARLAKKGVRIPAAPEDEEPGAP